MSHYQYHSDILNPYKILTFGDYVANNIDRSFINRSNIIPIGNYYIEDYYRQALNNDFLDNIKRKYKKIVIISYQTGFEEYINSIIKQTSLLTNDIYFLGLNKNKSLYQNISYYNNFEIRNDIDFFKALKYSI